MRITNILRAQLCESVYNTKKSFQKQLKRMPSTIFQYYYQLQIKQLHKSYGSNTEYILDFAQQNTHFKRYIRDEWDTLSMTKKRLYNALYFHFSQVDYRSINKFELARIMEIPTPAFSEYMLFRNKFKKQYEKIWKENQINPEPISLIVKSSNIQKIISRRHHCQSSKLTVKEQNASKGLKEIIDFTKRFQEMCKECKHVWNVQVTEEQKSEVRSKWEQQVLEFEELMDREVELLVSNLKKLSQIDPSSQALVTERPVTNTTNANRCFIFPLKKKNHS